MNLSALFWSVVVTYATVMLFYLWWTREEFLSDFKPKKYIHPKRAIVWITLHTIITFPYFYFEALCCMGELLDEIDDDEPSDDDLKPA